MKQFHNNQRIRVIEHPDQNMVGNIGTVERLRIKDDGAWVAMEKGLDTGDFPFYRQEGDSRQNNTLLYPEQCEPVV